MKVVGTRVNRVDGIDKVTGTTQYVDDLHLPRMLYAGVKRSDYAHAKIIRIDTKKAEALEGVKAVITGEHYKKKCGLYLEDKNFLAVDKVRYLGEAVAAVAAETEDIAKEAVKLIEIEYEELPAVFDAVKGMEPDAPLVHPDLGDYHYAKVFFPKAGTNISNHYKLRKGDVESGFEQADHIFEHEFKVPHVQHVPIENHSVIAKMDPDGTVTVWASCQSPFAVRRTLSVAFDLPLNKIRVISPAVGGGFGCKAGTTLEGIVIPLVMLTNGRPVKLTYSREDEFYNAFVRQGLHQTIKTGVMNSGKVVAVKNTLIWDGGAYNEYGVNIVKAGGYSSTGAYDIDNVWTDSYCVYTNHPVGGAYRGFGMSEIHFGIEQNMDMIALELGINPIEMRRINSLQAGSRNGMGQTIDQCGLLECIEKVVKHLDYDKSKNSENNDLVKGVGLACALKPPFMPNNAASSAIIKINEDGTAHLLVTAMDLGQGSDTVLTQIASEMLSIPVEKIKIKTGDTDYTPYEWQTVASRTTYSAGNAVIKACEDAKSQLLDLAQIKLGIIDRDLELEDEFIVSKIYPQKRIPICELAVGLSMEDGSGIHGPIIGRGVFIPDNLRNADPETGLGDNPVLFWTYGCHGMEIEVDKRTGIIRVVKAVAAYDVGKAINPQLLEGQIEGGIMQGLGTALWEELKLKDGKVLNASFTDYKIPTADDIPEMIIEIIENPEPKGAFGARGVGELAMIPAAPAVANALYDALAIRIMSMPLTAEKVLKAIKDKG
ncbi:MULTISPECIES: xanthine dehydrogenase family protein molybdopterin-binding subunit [unclassified Fusibacter]|uniref:xanthine dehydrogenase family protein molybdopterin-binding subunit n=1 Tax=unclassified Fusibacter TaxID=2624464 RepID=UPI0010103CC1|nr:MULTISPECIES: xanthine dehydrogenase family protein molybdopterin-binding subunit [unclassified Fusibacter]MCK8058547.1 xanthine dehydrogenase family protein molybdopterin-binding subunit [Fusibacter sp. A2]NPE22684.1 xanthine dehydrogenase family protein molybdopterin-binding subunit [Fusibacter sp. A1]RXV60245.1 xanthine dehydrogenase family protein molybdopterin-binding subunit [Fusibacter sp. A1]